MKGQISLFTGGQDRPYVFGLGTALASSGVRLDVIGSNEVDIAELRAFPNVNFLNLRGSQETGGSLPGKVLRLVLYYARLIRYASSASPALFHILWNNRLEFLDRTVLMLYYRLRGRKIVLTAHNVNARRRDGGDGLLNRFTLRVQYRLCDHIFVHTYKMKLELVESFGVREGVVSVIPFGINNSVPQTELTSKHARQRLGIEENERVILFFGRIGPYKGLDLLVAAFQRIAATDSIYRLIIAGRPKPGCEKYAETIWRTIDHDTSCDRVIRKIEFISDKDTEVYFKAADVLVLPYSEIFQSGVMFLGYSFGLPVIATDVGAFREDIIEGKTGFLCKAGDAVALAETIERYFASDLFMTLERRRDDIRDYAAAEHSWKTVSEMTRNVYASLLGWPRGGNIEW